MTIMLQSNVYRLTVLVVPLCFALACEPVLEGPGAPSVATPSPDAMPLDPGILCQEQHPADGTVVTVSGSGFSPVVFNIPADPNVALPTLTLVGARDLAGADADLGDIIYAGDPSGPNAGLLSWQSADTMALVVKDALKIGEATDAIPAGLYDLRVENADGQAGTSERALAVTAPPGVASLSPPLVCLEQGARSLTVEGSNALRIGDASPTVRIGDLSLSPTLEGCVDVAHPGFDAALCSSLTVDLAEDALPPGAHAVTIENPAPATCTSAADEVELVVVSPPAILEVQPTLACASGDTTDLLVTGTGFLRVDGADFAVTVGGNAVTPTAVSGCSTVDVAGLAVESCTSFVVTVDPAAIAEGLVAVSVTNPDPAGCDAVASDLFAVVPPPALASVDPSGVCSIGGTLDLAVTGSGFLRVDGEDFGVTVGGVAATPTNIEGCTTVGLSNATAEVCTSFTASVDTSTFPEGGVEVVVTNPAPASCSTADDQLFAIVPEPAIAAVTPSGICSLSAGVTELSVSGVGFMRADTEFTVTVGGESVAPENIGGCTTLDLGGTPVESCDSFTVTVDTSGFPEGPVAVEVQNPEVRQCSGVAQGAFYILGPPAVTGIAPDAVCSEVISTFDVVGTGLSLGTTVTIDGEVATNQAVNDAGTLLTVELASGLPAGTYDVGVSNGANCDALLAAALTVNPSPLVFFVDPPIVYSGIATEATIFVSDVTDDVTSVQLINDAGESTSLTFSSPVRPQRILATIPKDLAAGQYQVEVTSSDGCLSTLRGRLTVTDDTAIDIVSVDPSFVSSTVPTAVTITADPSGASFVSLPRVYLSSAGGAIALRAVELFDPTTLSAVVTGAAPGTYDLIVVNPTGEVGVLQEAVVVTVAEPPLISSVAPGSLDANATTDVVITGENFDTETNPLLSFECRDFETGAAVTAPTGIVTAATAEQLDATINGASVPAGAVCIVIVTNANGASFRYSAISFKEAAQNLNPFEPGTAMNEARRGLVLTAGRPTATSRFLYAIGGDEGGVASAKTSVESVPVDAFGEMGAWSLQRNHLGNARDAAGDPASFPRTLGGGVTIGRFIYLVGGDDGAGPVNTVLRAEILDPLLGPEIIDLDAALGDGVADEQTGEAEGLDGGLYLYRVSAMFPATDPSNPGGESLAGELFNVDLPAVDDKLVLTLSWTPVAGASGYRLYRTATADETADDLVLLAEVDGGNNTTFVDDDTSVPDVTVTPMPVGSLGVWHVASTLGENAGDERAEHATVTVPSPTPGEHFVYAVGGVDATGVSGEGKVATVTIAPNGTQTVSAWASLSATLSPARRGLSGMSINADDTPTAAGDTFLFFVGGWNASGTVSTAVEGAKIEPNGDILTYTSLAQPNPGRAGAAGTAANGFIFLFGGNNGAASNNDTSSELQVPIANPANVVIDGTNVNLSNWDGLGDGSMLQARLNLAAAAESAFFFVGGGSNGTTALSTIERTVQ